MGVLNWDPFAALAEIQSRGPLHTTGATPATHNPPQSVAPVAGVVRSGCQTVKTESLNCPSHWRAKLAALDPDKPPQSMAPNRWRTLLSDARWLAEAHGPAAAALGWTDAQLFGIDGAQGWGGLADRLDGARRVALTDKTARWRNENETGTLWRKGCTGGVPVWELPK